MATNIKYQQIQTINKVLDKIYYLATVFVPLKDVPEDEKKQAMELLVEMSHSMSPEIREEMRDHAVNLDNYDYPLELKKIHLKEIKDLLHMLTKAFDSIKLE